MANTVTEFDQYKVTNANIRWNNGGTLEAAIQLGFVGKLEIETEVKTITKKEEGDEVLNISIPTKLTGTLTGHMPVANFRKVFGLKDSDLKAGVYSYGTDSRQGKGVLTADVLDVYEVLKKLIAFPNLQFSDGFKWSLENGQEEIAEIEAPFQALKDEKGKFYYDAMESEITDNNVKTKWHTAFTPDLVAAASTTTG